MHGRTTIASALLLLGLSFPTQAQEGPPGLLLVEGGKTIIGTSVKDFEKMILEVNGARDVANTLVGETPAHRVTVHDFYLMPNEVTNEQYAEFVRATNSRPPYYWGEEALKEGRKAFLEAQGRARKEAREQGKRPPERKIFDPATWWEENWEGLEWEVPEGSLDRPVNYVSYYDARNYAAWAGLRLMTEEEYQRAARGDTDNIYPWGNEWDPTACNSLENKTAATGMPVGSFEKGAVNGIYDLVGNVYEWTDTRYTKYDGYKPLKIKLGKKEVLEPLAGFDPSLRVVVSGGYTTPGLGCRISFRQGTSKSQTTEALGFRCAADTVPGLTPARWLLEERIAIRLLPGDVEFDPEKVATLQHWSTDPGTAKVGGYAVITGHEQVLFLPTTGLRASSSSELGRVSAKNGPVVLGALLFDKPLRSPELDGGLYFLAWRGAAPLTGLPDPSAQPGGEAPDADPISLQLSETPGFDAEKECFVLYDEKGSTVLAWEAPPLTFARAKAPSRFDFQKFVPPTEKRPKDAPPIVPLDTLTLNVVVDAKSRKALMVPVEFKLSPGEIDESWK